MDRPILKNKIFLYLTEFFAGMSVMAVELGASRLLAPYFSSSQIVWTIIIGTIMIAMALGNIYGGKQADKNPNPDRLYARILIAAIWIALIPLAGKFVIAGISGLLVFTINSGFLVVAAFVSCMVIFVFPLFLLGTTTPCLVKYAMNNLEDNARTVGWLNASNTVGSIIGTFVPTFVTIPSVGTSVTFLIFAGILIALCLVYFITSKIFLVRMPAACAVLIVCAIFGHSSHFAFWTSDLVYEGESIYNYLQVTEDERNVSLSTNVLFGVQSVYQKDDAIIHDYYHYALAAPYMAGVLDKPDFRVLILGMGSGTYAANLDRYFPSVRVEGVEIDEKITEISRTYFHLDPDIPVATYDGRAYLAAVRDRYDLIMVDAYQDITIPFQMSSLEFFTLVSDHLTEDGVMIVNMNMRSDREGSINEYLSDTITHVFENVYRISVRSTTNRILFASHDPAILDRCGTALDEDIGPLPYFLKTYILPDLERCTPGPHILTDDRAPVELLGMRAIDDIIRDEIAYYKGVFEREGFAGLFRLITG